MRLGSIEADNLIFDILAVFALTAWAADGWRPWWGVFVALFAAAMAGGFVALVSFGVRRLSQRLSRFKASAELDADTFGIRVDRLRPSSQTLIAWSDIEEIVVFKADLFTVDCLTMLVRSTNGDFRTLDEQMTGWQIVLDALAVHLDCEPFESWFPAVAFPAFEPNERRIYPWYSAAAEAGMEMPTAPVDSRHLELSEPEAALAPVRAYLGTGTGGLFAAVAGLLTVVGFVQHDPRLWRVAATIVVYVALTRAAAVAYLRTRTLTPSP